ncbi:MAG: metallophosphoesterase, partial [Candidatus Heimdallarchaeota archaeon]|nr:metallophosphoesterase [Candidatus Heimdallarchaeota archaeon]
MKYILTADWHIRDTTPRCRTDNYWMKQWNKINQVLQIAQEEDAVVLIAGDVFDKPRVSNQTIEK